MSDQAPPRQQATADPLSSRRRKVEQGWVRWLPGLATLRDYELGWLRHDTVAGLVLITMLVPVGIAYATASGVPGVYGLYATIIPLLAYAIFGPSRILVLGPDSSLAAIILAVCFPGGIVCKPCKEKLLPVSLHGLYPLAAELCQTPQMTVRPDKILIE